MWKSFSTTSHRNRFLHVLLIEQRMINAQNNPVKQGTVQRLSHGVPRCDCLGGTDGLLAVDSVQVFCNPTKNDYTIQH